MNLSRMLSVGLVLGIWFAPVAAVQGQEKKPDEKKQEVPAKELAPLVEKGAKKGSTGSRKSRPPTAPGPNRTRSASPPWVAGPISPRPMNPSPATGAKP